MSTVLLTCGPVSLYASQPGRGVLLGRPQCKPLHAILFGGRGRPLTQEGCGAEGGNVKGLRRSVWGGSGKVLVPRESQGGSCGVWRLAGGCSGRRVVCRSSEEDKEDKGDPNRGDPRRSWQPWSWIGRLVSKLRLEPLVMLLFNIQLLFFLLRLWPVGGRGSGMAEAQAVNLQVPFSEFVSRVKTNEVDAVQMDGAELTFTVRSGSKLLKDLPEGSESVKVSYSTVRPADYPTPYDVLEGHGVRFSAVEKKGNALITALVSSVTMVIID